MSSRLYLSAFPSETYTPWSPAYDPSWDNASSMVRRYLALGRQGRAFVAYPVAGVNSTGAPHDVLIAQLLSDALAAQTIEGRVRGAFRVSQSAGGLLMAQMCIRVVGPDGTVRGTLLSAHSEALSSEFAETLAARKFPLAILQDDPGGASLTSVEAQAGDMLVVELGYCSTTVGSFTGTLELGSNCTEDLSGAEGETDEFAPWIEFTQDLVWATDVPGAPHYARDGRRADPDVSYVTQTHRGVDIDNVSYGPTTRSVPLVTQGDVTEALPPAPSAPTPPSDHVYYKMVGQLTTDVWVDWLVEDAPDYRGAYYTKGGTLRLGTIRES